MNHKHVKKFFFSLRLKKKNTDKGQIRLDGDKTCQGHPGTDQVQAGTDQG